MRITGGVHALHANSTKQLYKIEIRLLNIKIRNFFQFAFTK